MIQFKSDVEELWALEDERDERRATWTSVNPRALEDPPILDTANYRAVRERVAKGITRATDIANRHRVPVGIVSYPPPVIAGSAPAIQTTSFEIVLSDRTYRRGGVPREHVRDDLNRTLGVVEGEVRAELRHVSNPGWWLWQALVFVLRIPFRLLEATGFDIGKIEDNLWARLFKVAEVVDIAYLLGRWGLQGK